MPVLYCNLRDARTHEWRTPFPVIRSMGKGSPVKPARTRAGVKRQLAYWQRTLSALYVDHVMHDDMFVDFR